MTFPEHFVTIVEPGGEYQPGTCLFTRRPASNPVDPLYERVDIERNRVCFMRASEMVMLPWVVPLDALAWVLGEVVTANGNADEQQAAEPTGETRMSRLA
jgi:hypothetical protein